MSPQPPCNAVSRLPSEVIGDIVTYVGQMDAAPTAAIIKHMQERSMSSCALVCRGWREASQNALFADVTVRSIGRRLRDFHRFLHNHTRLAVAIRTLTLLSGTEGFAVLRAADLSDIAMVVDLLPGLLALIVDGDVLREGSALPNWRRTIPLNHLSIKGSMSATNLHSLLALFQQVDRAHITGWLLREQGPSTLHLDIELRVNRLQIQSAEIMSFFAFLAERRLLKFMVRSLEIRPRQAVGTKSGALSTVIEYFGPALAELTLLVAPGAIFDEGPPGILLSRGVSLARCKQLQTLYLELSTEHHYTGIAMRPTAMSRGWLVLEDILATVPETLQRLVIAPSTMAYVAHPLEESSIKQMRRLEWLALQSCIANRFRNLVAVEFVICDRPGMDPPYRPLKPVEQNDIRQVLPEFSEAGRLCFPSVC